MVKRKKIVSFRDKHQKVLLFFPFFQIVVFPVMSREKLGQVLEAFKYYKQFSDYCKKHPQAVEFVEQELPLCEEMVKLLPVKIMRMKQELGIN